MKSRLSLFSAFVAVSLAPWAPAQDPRVGLIAYWPLDGTINGDTQTPDVANGYHLSLVNMGAGSVVAGQRGNAFAFDGVSQLLVRDVLAEPSPGLPLVANAQRTVAFWVKGVGAGQNDKRIFAESSTASNNPLYDFGTANNGNNGTLDVFIRGTNGTTAVNHLRSNASPLDGAWHHVAVTDGGGSMSIYIDGVFDRTLTYTTQTLDTHILCLGGLRRATDAAFFNGQIDDVAVWNRRLTVDEIVAMKDNGLGSPIETYIGAAPVGPRRQGDRVALTAWAFAGGDALTYQWRRAGSDIPGATDREYLIPSLQADSAGEYTVVVNGVEADALTLTFTADPAPDVAQNLVSWWPAETLDTGVLPPTSPDPYGGNTLLCNNMVETSLSAGVFGNAFSFDGFSYGARSTGFPISTNPDFTVSLWVKGDGPSQGDLRVFSESSVDSNAPLFTLGTSNNSSQSLRVYIRSDANTVVLERNSTTPVFDGEWHHIVWSESNGRVRLYIDGAVDASSFDYSRASAITLNRTTLGAIERAAVSHWFTGQIDDAAVWNRALTWTEVQQLRTNGVPAPVVVVPPTITDDPTPSVTTYESRTVKLAVAAVGSGPLSYQWYKGDTLMPGATEPTLLLEDIQLDQAGTYTCRVTNSAATDISEPAVVTVVPVTPMITGRVALWPLDTADTTTPDSWGDQELTLFNMDSSAFSSPGRLGNCVTFDGVDDILIHTRTGVGQDRPLTTRPEYSIAFWVKGNGLGQSDRRVFSEGSTAATNPLFNIGTSADGSTQSMEFYVRGDNGAAPVAHPATFAAVLDDTWHHVVVTDMNGVFKVWVDGQPDYQATYTRPVSTLDTVSLGAIARATNSHWFLGQLDEVSTWERALSEAEVTTLYQQGLAAEAPPVITTFERTGAGNMCIEFTGTPSLLDYAVQTSTTLGFNTWELLAGANVVSLGENRYEVTFPAPVTGPVFYRIIGF